MNKNEDWYTIDTMTYLVTRIAARNVVYDAADSQIYEYVTNATRRNIVLFNTKNCTDHLIQVGISSSINKELENA